MSRRSTGDLWTPSLRNDISAKPWQIKPKPPAAPKVSRSKAPRPAQGVVPETDESELNREQSFAQLYPVISSSNHNNNMNSLMRFQQNPFDVAYPEQQHQQQQPFYQQYPGPIFHDPSYSSAMGIMGYPGPLINFGAGMGMGMGMMGAEQTPSSYVLMYPPATGPQPMAGAGMDSGWVEQSQLAAQQQVWQPPFSLPPQPQPQPHPPQTQQSSPQQQQHQQSAGASTLTAKPASSSSSSSTSPSPDSSTAAAANNNNQRIVAELEGANQRQRIEIEALKNEMERLKFDLENNRTKRDNQKQVISEQRYEMEQMKRGIDQQRQEIEAMRDGIEQQRAALEGQRRQIEQHMYEVESHKLELDSARHEIEVQKLQSEQFKTEAEKRGKQLQGLDTECARLESELSAAKERMKDVQDTTTRLVDVHTSTQDQFMALKEQNLKLKGFIQELTLKIHGYERELVAKDREYEAQAGKKRVAEEAVSMLRGELKDTKKVLKRTAEVCEQQQQLADDLQKKLDASARKEKEHSSEMQALAAQYEDKIQKIDSAVRRDLHIKTTQSESVTTRLQEKLTSLAAQFKAGEQRSDTLLARVHVYEQDLMAARRKVVSLKEQLATERGLKEMHAGQCQQLQLQLQSQAAALAQAAVREKELMNSGATGNTATTTKEAASTAARTGAAAGDGAGAGKPEAQSQSQPGTSTPQQQLDALVAMVRLNESTAQSVSGVRRDVQALVQRLGLAGSGGPTQNQATSQGPRGIGGKTARGVRFAGGVGRGQATAGSVPASSVPAPDPAVSASPDQANQLSASHLQAAERFRHEVRAIYERVNPQKLSDLPKIFSEWEGREEALLVAVRQKYS